MIDKRLDKAVKELRELVREVEHNETVDGEEPVIITLNDKANIEYLLENIQLLDKSKEERTNSEIFDLKLANGDLAKENERLNTTILDKDKDLEFYKQILLNLSMKKEL